jgi:hypothetical protein
LVTLLVVVLTACASTVAGPTAPTHSTATPPTPTPPVLTAEQALGDLTTIDYCSLLDLGKASDAGATHLDPVISAPDECAALATLDGQRILISVGYLASKTADPDRTADVTAKALDHGLKIQGTNYGSADACRRYLTFADGTHLATDVTFAADISGTVDQRADLCKIEAAVLDGLIADVTAKKASHLTFPAGTIGTVDACSVLPDIRATLPGPLAEGLQPVPAPTHHHCTWLDSVDYTEIEFSFDYGNLPSSPNLRIAGLATLSSPGEWSCTITTDLGTSPVRRVDQLAELYVRAPDAATDACGAAKTIATAAWPKLRRA